MLDDRGAAGGQDALVVGGMARQSASEMARLTTASPRNSSRSLCPSGVGVLVEPAAMDERLLEQVAIADRSPSRCRSASAGCTPPVARD